jgi:hypothetical protein
VVPIVSDGPVSPTRVFNTPFEAGVRSVLVLTSAYPMELALDQLTALDHLLVHTGDLVDGPDSLHPPEPTRATEMLVRRALVDSGLKLMACKGLVQLRATSNGFRYRAGDDAGSFVDLLSSSYASDLKARANWLFVHLVTLPTDEFEEVVASQLERWGIYDQTYLNSVNN